MVGPNQVLFLVIKYYKYLSIAISAVNTVQHLDHE